MKTAVALLLASLVLLAAACAQPAPTPAVPPPPTLPVAVVPGGAPGAVGEALADRGAALPSAERLIVRTADLTLVVADLGKALGQVEALAGRLGGYVVYTSRQGDEAAAISIRVPAGQFSPAMGELRALATRVEQESSLSQDVTEEYVDLEARLRNLEASEKQLVTLLERAQKVEDVVAIFRELSSIRERIETTRGRMQYLERTTALALIMVNLRPASSPQPVVKPGWSLWETVKDAARSLARLGQGLASAAIYLLVLAPVWLALVLIVFVLGRWLLRKL
ncbi:MAG: DUF4349 domain-containing protein [Chloroflexota bacterium]